MPIEVRELVIRAVINNSSQSGSNGQQQKTAGNDSGQQYRQLEDMVEQTLTALQEQNNER